MKSSAFLCSSEGDFPAPETLCQHWMQCALLVKKSWNPDGFVLTSEVVFVILGMSCFQQLDQGKHWREYTPLLLPWACYSHFSQTFERRSPVKSNRENSRERRKNQIHHRKCNQNTHRSCWRVSTDWLPPRQSTTPQLIHVLCQEQR